ncbi:RNA-binding protein 28-like [Tropilaelaps mercedesae]|uniref:RNA-binding protein 28-like n=1 Tax=Tropilaelaps mercedesae TaxID=418985 RepID=A0A1V9XLR3_9ACAR|nr:RNA-binding protein 28-like [Tropilaelaps mercedesae]
METDAVDGRDSAEAGTPDGGSKSSAPERKTLFVKNLPENTTKEQLELVFSEVGKLRHCFVVKNRRTEEFRGIGFVTFTDAASVDAALRRSFKLGSCQLNVSIAEDKKKKDAAGKPKPKISFSKEAKRARHLQKAKLIVRNLSFKATEADLEMNFGKFGKVLNINIPKKVDGKARGFAFIQFGNVPEAAKAVQALNATTILGRPVAVDFAIAKGKFEEVRKGKTAKKAEQKNSGNHPQETNGGSDADASHSATTGHASGGIKQITKQSTHKKKKRAFSSNGHAQQCATDHAEEQQGESRNGGEGSSDDDEESSDEETNDSKHENFVETKTGQAGGNSEEPMAEDDDENDESSSAACDESDSEVEFGSDGEIRLVKANQIKDPNRILRKTLPLSTLRPMTDERQKGGKQAASSDSEDEDVSEYSEDSDDEDEDGDKLNCAMHATAEDSTSDDDDDNGVEPVQNEKVKNPEAKINKSKEQAKAKKTQRKDNSESDSDWGHTPNDDSSEDDDAEKTEEDVEKAKRKREMIKKEDLSRTVFVKNISFDTTQTTFQAHMRKYGPYKFCLICMDKMLNRSKGTGFVKFEERADAAKCVASLQAGEVTLDGKVLSGSIALKRDHLHQKIQEKMDSKKAPKDKRNLYLAREGFIRGGTSAGAQVSDHDLKMRAKLEASKKKALKNLHNFVSTTRLCVHNLPFTCDEKQLRRIFSRAVDRTAKITETRVMRNMKKLGADGKGLSKGFGFVNFERHEDALKALRVVNNNPTIFTDQMRPIVSFSIENRAALLVKERRLKKSQQKLQELNQMKRRDPAGSARDSMNYEQGRRLPFEGLRAQVDMKTLPKRVGEKVRLDPKRRQHQIKLKRLARQRKRQPEFKKKKEKQPRGPTKAQLKERQIEKGLNEIIEHHRQKLRRQGIAD